MGSISKAIASAAVAAGAHVATNAEVCHHQESVLAFKLTSSESLHSWHQLSHSEPDKKKKTVTF